MKRSPPRTSPASGAVAGKKTFTDRCAGCHGLDGRGGQRAPDIASATARRLSDDELAKIIFDGKTELGMPTFRTLGRIEVQKIVDYLRVLQGKGPANSGTGDPGKGKAVFFGKAGCSSCHVVADRGDFVGTDLSTYARGLTPAEVRKAITDPAPSTARAKTAVATTHAGERFSGMVRNEDNFSVQMQSADGAFHFLMKSDLEKLEYQPLSPMPTDYGQRLTQQELDDLVAYLQNLKPEPQSEPREED